MKKLKIRKIGNSYGVTLPKELLEKLGVREGDELFALATANGVELTALDPDFEQALSAGRDFMNKYPNAMKKLAEG